MATITISDRLMSSLEQVAAINGVTAQDAANALLVNYVAANRNGFVPNEETMKAITEGQAITMGVVPDTLPSFGDADSLMEYLEGDE
ncbi:hypothetical protein [Bifidobacterium simiarum]|uniref:hypothetical protein n=1 Tax=Bifidobacterium simiarum TaxID=2045441 RepID=UPI001BDCD66E|nr:hypothetical protein [Bifidobacterium simiarum]MBT1166229.1 hypothetical protein [Bifidobacterium simiarum]